MPRKLKTFVTDVGFFQLAVAAPSKAAALRLWGMTHNAFAQGFAKETSDARIVAAAEAAPGTVLQRPLGGRGAFTSRAELPRVKAAKKEKPEKPKPDPKKLRVAEAALARAKARHEDKAKALRHRQDRLEEEIADEDAAWSREREKLEQAVRRAER